MPILRHFAAWSCILAIPLSAALPGCDSGPAAEPGKPIGVANPDPTNDLKHVTLDNEADNMKVLKDKTKAAPSPKSIGPTLPGQP
jgi:hypothetical protein